jgi:MFS transporter (putative signal transducer)
LTQTLPALLREAGASLQMAGLTALLWIPWGLRFLWAAAVDRWRLPAGQLERRSRRFGLVGQGLITAILLGLAALGGHLSPADHAIWILGGLLAAALVGATTDISFTS